MKRIVRVGLVLAICLLASLPLFASGGGESGAAVKPTAGKISFPYTGPEVTFTGYWVDLGAQDNTMILQEYRKRIGNIKFKWDLVTWADFDTRLKLMLSAGDFPDTTMSRPATNIVDTYGATGVLLDWNKYKDYMPNLQKWAAKYPHVNYLVDEQGHRYALYGFNTEDWAMEGWWYNVDTLKKAGVSVPSTLDEYKAALTKLKAADPTVNPWFSIWKLSYLTGSHSQLFGADESGLAFDDVKREWYYGPFKVDSNLKKTLELCNWMYKNKLVDPEIATMSDEMANSKLQEGKWGFMFHYHGWVADSFTSKNIKLTFESKPMAPPSWNGKAYVGVTVPYDGFPYWGIISPSKTKNPELLAALMDYNISDENTELFAWGIEGKSFKRNADGSIQYLPSIKLLTNPTGTVNLGTDIGLPRILDVLFSKGVVRAQQYQYYDDKAFEGLRFYEAGFKSGKITPRFNQIRPKLTQDEADKISSIMNPINTYISEMTTKFILGDESLANWDDFVAKIKKMGDVDYVLKVYNSKKQYTIDKRTW